MSSQDELNKDDVNKRALAGKLKSAFNSAVFLGFQKSVDLLREALDQVAPLTELEKKAASFMLTEAQLRTSLENEGNTLASKWGRKALEEKKRALEEKVLKNKKYFAADIARARKLAVEETNQPALAVILLEAQRARPPKTPPDQYYRELPRKSGAGGVLFIKDGKVLLLEPTYKAGLEIPGGTIDKDESPRETAVRECQEELGIKPEITRLLCTDYQRGTAQTGDSLQHIFLGAMGNQKIRMDYDEVGSLHWVPVEQAVVEISKHRPGLAGRVAAALSVIDSGETAYCEDGKQIFPVPVKAAAQIKQPRMG